jgi:hypothetical protein
VREGEGHCVRWPPMRNFLMSLLEVKSEIERLSSEERMELLVWMEDRDQLSADDITISMSKEELGQAIRMGLDQLDRGEFVSGDEAHERLRQRIL